LLSLTKNSKISKSQKRKKNTIISFSGKKKRPKLYLLLDSAVTLRTSSTLEEEGEGKIPRSILH
jgi:hypothetical protein